MVFRGLYIVLRIKLRSSPGKVSTLLVYHFSSLSINLIQIKFNRNQVNLKAIFTSLKCEVFGEGVRIQALLNLYCGMVRKFIKIEMVWSWSSNTAGSAFALQTDGQDLILSTLCSALNLPGEIFRAESGVTFQ